MTRKTRVEILQDKVKELEDKLVQVQTTQDTPSTDDSLLAPFRPRRWRGALLPHKAQVRLEVLETEKRPVSAVADHAEVRNVVQVDIAEDRSISLTMMFDAGRNLNERILNEQFVD